MFFSCLLVFFLFVGVFFLFIGVFFLVCWCFFCLLVFFFLVCWCFFVCLLVFFCLFAGVFFLVCWCFFSCLLVSHHANPTPPSKSPRNPKTFRYFVPRGTLIQSRISRSLFLIALYTCLMQCIDNKANKRTMIKGRASPVAITYRPNSNAMYPQNKVSTKYITNPIKYTISNHDFKITPK